MSDPKIPDLPDVGSDAGSWQRFMAAAREIIQTREGRRGAAADKGVTFRDLVALGLATLGTGGRWLGTGGGGSGAPGPPGIPGPPGPPGDPYVPDLTPPPTPENLRAVSLFRGVLIEWDPPVYTQGHGNAYTKVYVAQYGGTGPLPTFASAAYSGQAGGSTTIYQHDAAMGAQLHIWATFVTEDDVESPVPAGGLNGVQITVGRVGNSDLGPQIITADNLAAGAVTPAAFASGTNPVFFGSTLPTLPSATYPAGTLFIRTTNFKVYRSTGLTWTSAADGADIVAGTIVAGQVAAGGLQAGTITAGSAAIADGAIRNALIENLAVTNAKIASVSAAKLTAGAVAVGEYIQSSDFVAGSMGWRIMGSGAAEFSAAAIRGQLTAAQIGVSSLSALSANLGTVTIDNSGFLRGGQTAYATGAGFFLGYSGGAYKFSIGSGAQMLTWDGTNLSVPALTITGATSQGVNLIYNSAFEAGLDGWTSSTFGFTATVGTNLSSNWRLAPAGEPWTSVLFMEQVGGPQLAPNYYAHDLIARRIPVHPGRRYMLSAYVQAHRCIGAVFLRIYSAAGVLLVDGAAWADVTNNEQANAKTLDTFARLVGSVVAPDHASDPAQRASYVEVTLRKWATSNGPAPDSYLFATRLQLEEVAANVTTPSAWSDGARQHIITAANIGAYIANLAIGNAQIGGNLYSDNYVADEAGWIIRKADGYAEFQSVKVRGDIQATSISAGVLNIVETKHIVGSAVTNVVTSIISGVAWTSPTTGASRTSSVTLGVITTSTSGDGKVLVLFSVDQTGSSGGAESFGYIGKAKVETPNVGTHNIYLRIKRNGTIIRQRKYTWNGNFDRTLIDPTVLIYDTPGAGVTATYTYEVYSVTAGVEPETTTHKHEVLPADVVLLELRK